MPETQEIVINTGPIIALVAALGDLRVLQIYQRVWVPFEVCQEIVIGGKARFALAEFEVAHWLQKHPHSLQIAPGLRNTLDKGEAAVIQLALDKAVSTVCIDEPAGRRAARLYDLALTGSVGILLRALREGYTFSMRAAIERMRTHGIRLSTRVIEFALTQAGEYGVVSRD